MAYNHSAYGFNYTFLSNASLKEHPNNTAWRFIIDLKEPFVFDEPYLVGLTEFHLPIDYLHTSFMRIYDKSNRNRRFTLDDLGIPTVAVRAEQDTKKAKLFTEKVIASQAGETPETAEEDEEKGIEDNKARDQEVGQALNLRAATLHALAMKSKADTAKLKSEISNWEAGTERILKNELKIARSRRDNAEKRALGAIQHLKRSQNDYILLTDIMQSNNVIFPEVNAVDAVVKSAVPRCLFLYSDLVKPHQMGDTYAGYLRTVRVPPPLPIYGMTHRDNFDGVVPYYPVANHTYQQIEINITDETGALPPVTSGTVSGTLHFQPVRAFANNSSGQDKLIKDLLSTLSDFLKSNIITSSANHPSAAKRQRYF